MSEKRPKLTIAIPTYNRADNLKTCLSRVIEYKKGLDIEIIVSDNASTDNTTEVVSEMQRDYPEIIYFRNDNNLGFDGNFLNCFERANGEYVWLLSDDDYILPDALESILEGCSRKPVCMHLNTSGIKSEEPLLLSTPRLSEAGIIEYRDRNNFIEAVGIYCTFVSSLIFNVDYVRKISDKSRFFGSNILQSHILFEIMKYDGLYLIISNNCVAAKGNTTVHYDLFQTWICNYSELLLTTAPACGFDRDRMENVLRKGLDTTVYGFVLKFRTTCPDENTWNRDGIWKYIERYPELIRKYRVAVDCSKNKLFFLKLIEDIKIVILNLLYGKENG